MTITLRTKRLVGALATLGLLGALGVIIFAWSGLYSVAASRGHWPIMDWFLTFGMQNSVETHARGIVAPPLDHLDMVKLGAAHFHTSCAPCHGAPGTPTSTVTQHTLPSPPNLVTKMRPWSDGELFWIVKNGLKYTAMPAWPVQNRDDEVWAMVAFLKRIGGLDKDSYQELASGGVTLTTKDQAVLASPDSIAGLQEKIEACARCHGATARAPSTGLVPVLHGQSSEFMVQSLTDYAAHRRSSGIMQQAASSLEPNEIKLIAEYYASLQLPNRPDKQQINNSGDAALARGKLIAEHGDTQNKIPACIGCHGPDALPLYPRLTGQSARYMSDRLKLWHSGRISPTPTDAIMMPIARALNEQQIADVVAYFSALPRPPSGTQR